MKQKSIVNMAFATGAESTETAQFDLYTGVVPFKILAVNPTVEELREIYPNRDEINEPVYKHNKEGEAQGIFVTFFLQSVVEDIDIITRASYFLKDEPYYNKDKTKVQVINKYGDTGWLTLENLKEKTLPEYLEKQQYNTAGMRPAYRGEEDLVNFLRTFINIPISRTYTKESGWTPKEGVELAKAECGFDLPDIKKLIEGDMTPVKNGIKYRPDNKLKMLLGVKTMDDNKQYQEVLTRLPLKLGVTDYGRLNKQLNELRDAGLYENTDFGVYPFPITKYEVGATSFSSTKEDTIDPADDPFAGFAS